MKVSIIQDTSRIRLSFLCLDCGFDTFQREYYMVLDKVWKKAGLGPDDGMLCIGCLEKRIGRTLVPRDFKKLPVNDLDPQYMTARLYSRIIGYNYEDPNPRRDHDRRRPNSRRS